MAETRLNGKAAVDAINDGAIAIDVRSESRRAEAGSIPGALVLSKQDLIGALKNNSIGRLSSNQKIVLFCSSEKGTDLAVETLRASGIENVYDVAGGFGALLKGGLSSVEESAPLPD